MPLNLVASRQIVVNALRDSETKFFTESEGENVSFRTSNPVSRLRWLSPNRDTQVVLEYRCGEWNKVYKQSLAGRASQKRKRIAPYS